MNKNKNKIIIFLIIFIIIFGSFLIYKQIKNKTYKNSLLNQILNKQEKIYPNTIEEKMLIEQVKNKKYFESAFIALEYTKVNNEKLINELTSFVDNNSNIEKEDIYDIVNLQEKNFLNKYLKVYLLSTDIKLENDDINKNVMKIFYDMKEAYNNMRNFKIDPNRVDLSSQDPNATQNQSGGNFQLSNGNQNNQNQPQNLIDSYATSSSTKKEIVYEIENLRKGIEQLKEVNKLVDETIKMLGKEDLEIETYWLIANLKEKDIIQVLDNSNSTNNMDTIQKEDGYISTPKYDLSVLDVIQNYYKGMEEENYDMVLSQISNNSILYNNLKNDLLRIFDTTDIKYVLLDINIVSQTDSTTIVKYIVKQMDVNNTNKIIKNEYKTVLKKTDTQWQIYSIEKQ